MNSYIRRTFVKTIGLGITAASVPLLGWSPSRKLDPYGGLKSIKFDATGFFSLEKEDRWWFVTPEGSAFLSFGLNHPDAEYLLQEYNIDFWAERFGARDRNDPASLNYFIEKVMKDLEVFGMNTIGTHARKEYYGKSTHNLCSGFVFCQHSLLEDRLSGILLMFIQLLFEKSCDQIAQRVVHPKREDPFLLGYTLTDCPVLTDSDAAAHGQDPWGGPAPEAPTWPRVLRNLGPEAPGKRVYVSLMRNHYPTIQDFNLVYHSQFSSFDSLLDEINWSSFLSVEETDDLKDNHAFLLDILDKYYTVARAAIRKYDPNHLIFGDIINAQTPPPDDVVFLMAGYSDLIAYQFYGGYDEQSLLLDKWSKMTGKPLFHADSSFCVPYKEMPNPVGAVCPDQETRAKRFLDFASKAFSRPDFIGW